MFLPMLFFVLLLYVPSQQLWSWLWASLNKQLTSTLCTYFCLYLTTTLLEWCSGREDNEHKNYFMINRHESMGPGRDRSRNPLPMLWYLNIHILLYSYLILVHANMTCACTFYNIMMFLKKIIITKITLKLAKQRLIWYYLIIVIFYRWLTLCLRLEVWMQCSQSLVKYEYNRFVWYYLHKAT